MARFVSYRVGLGERSATKYINLEYVQEAQFVGSTKDNEAVLTLTLADGTLQTLRGPEAEEGKKLLDAA